MDRLITSGLTAFYMFRLYFGIFWNKAPSLKERAGGEAHAHGEGGFAMMMPLVLLALALRQQDLFLLEILLVLMDPHWNRISI